MIRPHDPRTVTRNPVSVAVVIARSIDILLRELPFSLFGEAILEGAPDPEHVALIGVTQTCDTREAAVALNLREIAGTCLEAPVWEPII